MAKRPEKKRDGKGDAQPPLPTSSTARILPMQLQVGDRLTDETGEYEIIGRPSTTPCRWLTFCMMALFGASSS
jgi:hypothetical protein